MERELRLFQLMLSYLEKLLDGIDDQRMAEQPLGANHPAWILGHLTVTTGFGLKLLGQKLPYPKHWLTQFGPGSQPSSSRQDYPGKEELLLTFRQTTQQLIGLVPLVTPEQLAAENPGRILKEELPTVGDILAHLLTTHLATHIGQLSTWRRIQGLPPALNL